MGPRGSSAETAFANALVNNKDGFTTLLAVVAPNLLVKPYTILFNKVTIKNAKQAVQMFGPAQYGVAKAVADSVAEGIIPIEPGRRPLHLASACSFIGKPMTIRRSRTSTTRATKEAIARAMKGDPSASKVLSERVTAKHPFAAQLSRGGCLPTERSLRAPFFCSA